MKFSNRIHHVEGRVELELVEIPPKRNRRPDLIPLIMELREKVS